MAKKKRVYPMGVCANSKVCGSEPKEIVAHGLCGTCYHRDWLEIQRRLTESDLREHPSTLTTGEQIIICADIMAVARGFTKALRHKHLPQVVRDELETMQDRLRELNHKLSGEPEEPEDEEPEEEGLPSPAKEATAPLGPTPPPPSAEKKLNR